MTLRLELMPLRRSTTPPQRHLAAADDDLDAFAGPPRALSVLSEQGTVTERLLWMVLYDLPFTLFASKSRGAHFTGLVRPQNHSPRSKPSDQTNGVPLRALLVEGVLGPGAPRLSQRVRARRPKTAAAACF